MALKFKQFWRLSWHSLTSKLSSCYPVGLPSAARIFPISLALFITSFCWEPPQLHWPSLVQVSTLYKWTSSSSQSLHLTTERPHAVLNHLKHYLSRAPQVGSSPLCEVRPTPPPLCFVFWTTRLKYIVNPLYSSTEKIHAFRSPLKALPRDLLPVPLCTAKLVYLPHFPMLCPLASHGN